MDEKSKNNNSSSPLQVIISGAPASGKGTQCEFIKEKYGVVHLSTGDILRAAVAANNEIGKAAKEYMDSGQLVPDNIIIKMVKGRLGEDDCKKNGWLLDGFPRTSAQADALTESGIVPDCFLFLSVPDEILVERVVGRRSDPITGKIYHMTFSPPPTGKDGEAVLARLVQRGDDTEEKVKIRLEYFHANIQAVKERYIDFLVEIDGAAKPADIAKAVQVAVDSKTVTQPPTNM